MKLTGIVFLKYALTRCCWQVSFWQKRMFWISSAQICTKLVPIYSKRHLQNDSMSVFPLTSRFVTVISAWVCAGAENFSHPNSRSKISNLMTKELYCAHILNMKFRTEVLFIYGASFKRILLSVFRYRSTKNGSVAGPKSFLDFRETGPRIARLKGFFGPKYLMYPLL